MTLTKENVDFVMNLAVGILLLPVIILIVRTVISLKICVRKKFDVRKTN